MAMGQDRVHARKSLPRRVVGTILWIVYGLWCLAAVPMAVYLLIEGRTIGGRVVGALLAHLVVLPLTLRLGRRHRCPAWRAVNGVLATTGLSLLILTGGLALPRELPSPRNVKAPASYQPGIFGGRPYSRFIGSKGKLTSFLSNLLPEVEHVALAGRLLPRLNAGVSPEQAERAAGAAIEIYRAMDADEVFSALSSSLAIAYADRLGAHRRPNHYFLYVPKSRRPGPMPMLVFLHDATGNLKAYLWALSRLAEQEGCVVVTPSFGYGDWSRDGSAQAVLAAEDDASALVDVDGERVFLAGLGCGGAGAGAAFRAAPQRFRGLAFLAARPDDAGDLSAARGRSVLVLSGQADPRVPAESVSGWTQQLRQAGVEAKEFLLPSQDRFLLFTAPNETASALADWIRATIDPGQG